MEDKRLAAWADRAVKQMKYPPDREAVRREILDHMQDRQLDHMEQGMTEDEAAEKALAAMGDADVVGKALNKAHRPWLGWLWLCSKVLAILTVLSLILFLMGESGRFDTLWEQFRDDYLERDACWYDLSGSYTSFAEGHQPIEAALEQKAGDYTVTLDHGYYFESTGLYEEYLALCFWVRSQYPWDAPPLGLRNVVIEDDAGGIHTPGVTSECRLECTEGLPGLWKVHLRVFIPGGLHTESMNRRWFRVCLEGTGLDFTVYTNGEVAS